MRGLLLEDWATRWRPLAAELDGVPASGDPGYMAYRPQDPVPVEYRHRPKLAVPRIAGATSDVGMLIVNTWRNCNEIWETVCLKDLPRNVPLPSL